MSAIALPRIVEVEDLESAVGPAIALLLIGLERVGQQAMAVAPVGVMRDPAILEDREAEIAVPAGIAFGRLSGARDFVTRKQIPAQTSALPRCLQS